MIMIRSRPRRSHPRRSHPRLSHRRRVLLLRRLWRTVGGSRRPRALALWRRELVARRERRALNLCPDAVAADASSERQTPRRRA